MSIYLECKKIKRTGFAVSFFGGGLLAALIPVLQMTVRSDLYIHIDASPIQILMDANWQMMAMLNLLLVAAGACLLYHTEYTNRGLQKMCTLPLREARLFLGKAMLLSLMCILILAIETVSILFCVTHWFELTKDLWAELLSGWGYTLLLLLPAALGSLWIASICQNIWISLGILVVCIFTATILPAKHTALALFPFALPFQMLPGATADLISHFVIASVAELFLFALAEILCIKIRRFVA